MKKDIFTIDLTDIKEEESIYDYRCTQHYDSIPEAIIAAKEVLQEHDDERCLMATVYAGEYMMDSGDIYGEPHDVWTGTNKDVVTCRAARKEAGFCCEDVDFYLHHDFYKMLALTDEQQTVLKELEDAVLKSIRSGIRLAYLPGYDVYAYNSKDVNCFDAPSNAAYSNGKEEIDVTQLHSTAIPLGFIETPEPTTLVAFDY